MGAYYCVSMFNADTYKNYSEALGDNAVYQTSSTIDCVVNDGGNLTGILDLLEVISVAEKCTGAGNLCVGVITEKGFITLDQITQLGGATCTDDIEPLKGNEKVINN